MMPLLEDEKPRPRRSRHFRRPLRTTLRVRGYATGLPSGVFVHGRQEAQSHSSGMGLLADTHLPHDASAAEGARLAHIGRHALGAVEFGIDTGETVPDLDEPFKANVAVVGFARQPVRLAHQSLSLPAIKPHLRLLLRPCFGDHTCSKDTRSRAKHCTLRLVRSPTSGPRRGSPLFERNKVLRTGSAVRAKWANRRNGWPSADLMSGGLAGS